MKSLSNVSGTNLFLVRNFPQVKVLNRTNRMTKTLESTSTTLESTSTPDIKSTSTALESTSTTLESTSTKNPIRMSTSTRIPIKESTSTPNWELSSQISKDIDQSLEEMNEVRMSLQIIKKMIWKVKGQFTLKRPMVRKLISIWERILNLPRELLRWDTTSKYSRHVSVLRRENTRIS